MPHLFPVVIPGGASLIGSSLGFHAYSLRLDNLTNQWLQEESSLAWVPPYSLGTCIRLYGTAVAIILNRAPQGQPQPTPIGGEYASGFFSDELRTEVAGAAVRQFTIVQAVSDLTQGPQPAFPPVGVDRLWADTSGNIHHLHSTGVDLTLVDPSQTGVVTGAMILDRTITAIDIASGTITGNEVGIGTLTGSNMASRSVSGAQIALGTIDSSNMGNLTFLSLTDAADPGPGPANGSYLFSSSANGSIYRHRTGNPASRLIDDVTGLGGVLGGTLPNPSMAANAAWNNLAQGQIALMIASFNQTADVWNNVALGAGDNTVSGNSVVGTVPETGDLVLFNVDATASIVNPTAGVFCGWMAYVDGAFFRAGPMLFCPQNQTTAVSWAGSLAVAGTGTLAGGLSAGAHTFELRFRAHVAIGSGAYLLCASQNQIYRMQLEVWVLRR